MEGKEEDVRVGANKFPERQPIGTSAQNDKDYKEPPPAPLFKPGELASWSFWRAEIDWLFFRFWAGEMVTASLAWRNHRTSLLTSSFDPWEHVVGMGLGAVFANQLVKWDVKLKEDLDVMLAKARAANERRYFDEDRD